MPKKYYGYSKDGGLVLPKLQEESRKSYLRSVDSQALVEEIKIWKPTKSQKQLGAIFGHAFKRIVREFDDNGWDTSMLFRLENPTGIPITKDLLKVYFYSVCPIFDDAGNVITLSSEHCTMEKAAEYYGNIQAWASSQWNIFIPDPDPNWKLKT